MSSQPLSLLVTQLRVDESLVLHGDAGRLGWLRWHPDEEAWSAAIRFEKRYSELDRACDIFRAFVPLPPPLSFSLVIPPSECNTYPSTNITK